MMIFPAKGHLARIVAACLIIMAPALVLRPAPAHARSCPAGGIVLTAGKSFKAAARSGSPAAFQRVLRRHVAMRSLSLFALGKYRRLLPRNAYGRFINASTQYISRKLARYADSFGGADIKVSSCRGSMIETRLIPGGQRIFWRLNGRRIRDVQFQGVWLSIALRNHYAKLMRKSGGDMKRFLARLK